MAVQAVNPQTGERIEFVNGEWRPVVPLPVGGLSFANMPADAVRTRGPSPGGDPGWVEQFGRSLVQAAGPQNIEAIGGMAGVLGFPETGEDIAGFGERYGVEPAGVQSAEQIESFGDVPSYVANMLGQGVGSIAAPAASAITGAAIGGAAGGPPGAVAGGVTGGLLASYAVQTGLLYRELLDLGTDVETARAAAAAAGAAMAGLDTFSLTRLIPGLSGAARSAVLRRIAEAAGVEAATEVGQTAIEEGTQAAVAPLYDPSGMGYRFIDAAVGGALGGGAFRAGAEAVAAATAPRAAPPPAPEPFRQPGPLALPAPEPNFEVVRPLREEIESINRGLARREAVLAENPGNALVQNQIDALTARRRNIEERLARLASGEVRAAPGSSTAPAAGSVDVPGGAPRPIRTTTAADLPAARDQAAQVVPTEPAQPDVETPLSRLTAQLARVRGQIASVQRMAASAPGVPVYQGALDRSQAQEARLGNLLAREQRLTGPTPRRGGKVAPPVKTTAGDFDPVYDPDDESRVVGFQGRSTPEFLTVPEYQARFPEAEGGQAEMAPAAAPVVADTGAAPAPAPEAEAPLTVPPAAPVEPPASLAGVEPAPIEQGAPVAPDVASPVVEGQPDAAPAVTAPDAAVASPSVVEAEAAQPATAPVPDTPPPSRAEGEPRSARIVEPSAATLPSGRALPVDYAVVEASDVIPSNTLTGGRERRYPQDLQPRDRSTPEARREIARRAEMLNPAEIDRQAGANEGAPIIGPDGIVESGNGRAMAIRQAYARKLPTASRIRSYLAQQGYPVEGMREPMLVRINREPMTPQQRTDFAREANGLKTEASPETGARDAAKPAPAAPTTKAPERGKKRSQPEADAAKGDAVAVRVVDYDRPGGKKTVFELATVVSTNKSGRVSKIRRAGWDQDWAPPGLQVNVIGDPDLQAAAREIVRETPAGGRKYESADDLRAAISARRDSLGSRQDAEKSNAVTSRKIENRVRKGDVVVVPVERSMTYAGGRTERTTDYVIAVVERADRDGLARSVRSGWRTWEPSGAMVVSDADIVEAARSLVAPANEPPTEYRSLDDVRAAVRDRRSARQEAAPEAVTLGEDDRAQVSSPGRSEGARQAADTRDVQKNVSDMLRRLTGRDVPFRLVRNVTMGDGRNAAGAFLKGDNAVVVAAYADDGTRFSPDDVFSIARHEAIHYMRANDLFPRDVWAALEKKAPEWRRRFDIDAAYPNATESVRNEEAIAEAYRRWSIGRLRARGLIQQALETIKEFFSGIRGALRESGFNTINEVFEGIEAGEFAMPNDRFVSSRPAPDTPAFRNWFGRSKVVDSEGRPLVVFHGTNADIESFDMAQRGRSTGAKSAQMGFFFASEPDVASSYVDVSDPYRVGLVGLINKVTRGAYERFNEGAVRKLGLRSPRREGANVLPVYLAIENPLVIDQAGRTYRDSTYADVIRQAKALGYDGVIIKNTFDPGWDQPREADLGVYGDRQTDVYVAFWPEQIKSAISNVGTYDSSDARIRYKVRLGDDAFVQAPAGQALDAMAMAMSLAGTTPTNLLTMPVDAIVRASMAKNYGALNWLLGPNRRVQVGTFLDMARERIQDYLLPVKRVQEAIEMKTGKPVPEFADAYRAEEAMYSRRRDWEIAGDRDYREPIIETMRREKIDLADVDDYLAALHAPERNAQIARVNPGKTDGSGMTDAEAKAIVDKAHRGPKAEAFREIARLTRAMLDKRLDIAVETGRLSQIEADRLKATYPNYVPLRGVSDPDLDEKTHARIRSGLGFRGARGSAGGPRATGRFSKAPDVLATAMTMYDEAVILGEKNMVSAAVYNLAASNPDPAMWEVAPVKTKAVIDKTTGLVRYKREAEQGEDVIFAKVDGKEYRVKLYDEGMLRALKRLDTPTVGPTLQVLMFINRWLSALNTTFNPEFLVTNFTRDIQTAGINVQQYEKDGVFRKATSYIPKAIRGSMGYLRKKPVNTEWRQWAERMAKAGGMTAFNDVRSVEDRVRDIRADLADPTAARKIYRGIRAGLRFVEDANNAVDNGVRLATFRALVEAGVPEKKAGSAVKNLTVNFNRKGSQGPTLNAFFLFYNAAMQGTATLAAAAKSRKVQKWIGAVVAFGAIQELLMSMLAPEDEDDPLRTVYDAIPEYVKQRSLVLWVNEDGSYLSFPMPYGYNFFHNLGRLATRHFRQAPSATGQPFSIGQTIGDLATAFTQAFIPPGFDNVLPLPTVFQPVLDVYLNEDYAGRAISPPRRPGDTSPDSQMYYPSTPGWYVQTAQFMNSLTGGTEFRPGLIDFSPDSMQHIVENFMGATGSFYSRLLSDVWQVSKAAVGENVEPLDFGVRNVPFVRRVAGQLSDWRIRDVTYQRIAEIELLETEISGYQERGDLARAREIRAESGPLVGMVSTARRVRRELADIRRTRADILDSGADTAIIRARLERLDAREKRILDTFNRRYLQALSRVQARSDG